MNTRYVMTVILALGMLSCDRSDVEQATTGQRTQLVNEGVIAVDWPKEMFVSRTASSHRDDSVIFVTDAMGAGHLTLLRWQVGETTVDELDISDRSQPLFVKSGELLAVVPDVLTDSGTIWRTDPWGEKIAALPEGGDGSAIPGGDLLGIEYMSHPSKPRWGVKLLRVSEDGAEQIVDVSHDEHQFIELRDSVGRSTMIVAGMTEEQFFGSTSEIVNYIYRPEQDEPIRVIDERLQASALEGDTPRDFTPAMIPEMGVALVCLGEVPWRCIDSVTGEIHGVLQPTSAGKTHDWGAVLDAGFIEDDTFWTLERRRTQEAFSIRRWSLTNEGLQMTGEVDLGGEGEGPEWARVGVIDQEKVLYYPYATPTPNEVAVDMVRLSDMRLFKEAFLIPVQASPQIATLNDRIVYPVEEGIKVLRVTMSAAAADGDENGE